MLTAAWTSAHAPRAVRHGVLPLLADAVQGRTATGMRPAPYGFTGVMVGFATGIAVRPTNGRTSVRASPPI
jgi:hypothetical protein